MANTLLDEPIDTGVRSACAACGQRTGGRGDVLCSVCWKKAPRELIGAYRRAWNAVQFEAQPESRLALALGNLVAGVRGEALPYAEPPPILPAAPPAPAPPTPSILPPLEDRDDRALMPTSKKVRAMCGKCEMAFEYSSNGGRPRTTCDTCKERSSRAEETPTPKRVTRAADTRVAPPHRPKRAEAKPTETFFASLADVTPMREQLRAEHALLTERVERIARLLEAFDAYEAAE